MALASAPAPTTWRCRCGFSSPSALALRRHLTSFSSGSGEGAATAAVSALHAPLLPSCQRGTSTAGAAAAASQQQQQPKRALLRRATGAVLAAAATTASPLPLRDRILGGLSQSPLFNGRNEGNDPNRLRHPGPPSPSAVAFPAAHALEGCLLRDLDLAAPSPPSVSKSQPQQQHMDAKENPPARKKPVSKNRLGGGGVAPAPAAAERRRSLVPSSSPPPPPAHLSSFPVLEPSDGEGRGQRPPSCSAPSHNRHRHSRSPWITPERLERLLSWTDPRASLRACAASLYALVCLRAAIRNAAEVRPASVCAFAGLAVLAWHAAGRPLSLGAVRLLAARARATARGVGGEQQERRQRQLLARIEGALASSSSAASSLEGGDDDDARLAARIEATITCLVSVVAPLVSSVAVVAHRRLSGRAGHWPRVLCGLGLWAVAAASESSSSSSSSTTTMLLAAAVVVASFAAKPLVDAAAADAVAAGGALRAAVSALVAADARGSALSAAAAGGGALALLRSWSAFARVSAAAISAVFVLGWRLHARASAAAAALEGGEEREGTEQQR